ncbi:MAG: PKD domain-containing protein [Chitinophagaceae bacterium]
MKKLLLMYLLGCPFFSAAQQIAKNLTASNGVFIGFYEYKPVDYNTDLTTKYPVIIFLHGIGERGDGVTNLPLVLSNGVPKNINAGHTMRFFWNGKWETFLVLSPQLSNVYGDWPNFYVDEMLKYAKQNLRIDPNRVFLTGLSLGGGSVWRYASSTLAAANEFAGIAPVCGTCAIGNPCNISNAKLPVWAFHALDDGIVGAGCTTSSILGINNCNPAVKPLMTLYPSGGHGIWGRSYDTEYNYHDPNMYEWFLGQNRSLPTNILPIAKAGNDQAISLNTNVTLNGSNSTDADGNLVRYTWSKLSGPASGVINSPVTTNGISTISGLTIEGTYQYELKVLDNRASSSLDTITITVTTGISGTNNAPFAKAGPDISLTLPTNNTTLNGASSYDSDGSIINFSWTKISGPTQYFLSSPSNPSSSLTNLVQGSYNFQLLVTDNNGSSSKDTVAVIINTTAPPPSNYYPIARAGSDITITLPSNSVSLNSNSSYDPDGIIVSYNWSKISGPTQYTISNSSEVAPTVSALASGSYHFRLMVTDDGGLSTYDTVVVIVNSNGSQSPPLTNSPLAKAGADISINLPTNSVSVNGYNSYDPDGIIVSYNWSKISGPVQYNISNVSDGATTITNLAQGSYQFRLLVTDNSGSTGMDTVMVTVLPGAAPPPNSLAPIAKAGPNFSLTLPTNTGTLNGYNSYDPDGIIVSYNWSKIAGPAQYNISNVSNGSTTVTNLVQGSYKFRLSVADNSGMTADDTVTLIVNFGTITPPPASIPPFAKAGTDISITTPASSVTLNGYNSYDPDGIIVSYAWSKITGPAQYQIYNSSAGNTTVSNLTSGFYQFHLKVTDNTGITAYDTVNVTVGIATNGLTTSTQKASIELIENLSTEKIIVYPNPAINFITIRYSGNITGQSKMTIFDLSGKTLKQVPFYKSASSHEIPVSISDFRTGIYIVEIITDKQKRVVTKFSKQ